MIRTPTSGSSQGAMGSRAGSDAALVAMWFDAEVVLTSSSSSSSQLRDEPTASTEQQQLSDIRALLEVREDQVDELRVVSEVYPHQTQLQKDRFHRLLLRCSVSIQESHGGTISADVTFVLPPEYPAVGAPLEVRTSSRRGSKDFLSSLATQLRADALDHAERGDPALLNLLGKAIEVMHDMPKAIKATTYACCISCNTKRLKAKEEKIPQPAVQDDYGRCKCLSCGSSEDVLPLPMIRTVSEADEASTVCSFCFTSDSSLIFLDCKCIACFECFVHMSDLAIGSKQLSKVPYKRGVTLDKFEPQPRPLQLLQEFVGIPCANHKNSPQAIISHPALLKLLPPRTYNRFNFFAMEKSLVSSDPTEGVVTCPLPLCCGYPFITDQPGTLVECPFCGDFFCVRCKQGIDEGERCCTCEKYPEVLHINTMQLAERFGVADYLPRKSRIDDSENRFDRQLVVGASPSSTAVSYTASGPSAFVVLVFLRNRPASISLPAEGEWYPRLANLVIYSSDLCPYAETHRQREAGVFVCVFHGRVLDLNRSLASQQLFTGAIILVVETFYATDLTRRRTEDAALRLWSISRSDAARVIHKKKCPVCATPVLHYLGHGCHMIYGCHPGMPEWCYVCGSTATSHRCPSGCPLFCKFEVQNAGGRAFIKPVGCDCLLCPDCKPLRPCDLCTLCPMCTMSGTTMLI